MVFVSCSIGLVDVNIGDVVNVQTLYTVDGNTYRRSERVQITAWGETIPPVKTRALNKLATRPSCSGVFVERCLDLENNVFVVEEWASDVLAFCALGGILNHRF